MKLKDLRPDLNPPLADELVTDVHVGGIFVNPFLDTGDFEMRQFLVARRQSSGKEMNVDLFPLETIFIALEHEQSSSK